MDNEYRDYLSDLLELEEGLTRWEVDLIEQLSHLQVEFWQAWQKEKVAEIWRKHCG